ncbi:alkaline phosphatase family protein [Haloarchaeobius iranensis]|uniref:Predicted pyrophosphatase or phosphodiesterase, AlkP superfamily n=1 Tax=Haloarchaeobius iranensis TaxID=996166 RepID=A0A1G9WN72_9EURY|nr:alkaline phosphatase family protein [Haloarchaeobius iranensis]SDM85663.1 Predicted pyrophosphatase or phosphodiesterase, AlkP superfamily [Haloarchaeobius iranensis]
MLRTDVAASLRDRFEDDGFLFPDYDGYCFANVPGSVASLLGADAGRSLPADTFGGVDTDDIETVLVVLVDGFGWTQWRRERTHHGFLDRLSAAARVTPLTSIYPSETAAAITTFHTGALPAKHGVVGWNVHDPASGETFEALPFLTKAGEEPNGLGPDDVFDADAIYPSLAEQGVEAHHAVPFEETYEGATAHTYGSLDELPGQLRAAVDAADGRSYCFCYVPHVDHEGHRTGTRSDAYRETVGEVFEAVERALAGLDDETREETLLLVTADHGHVDTDPAHNVDLDADAELVDALAEGPDGEPIRFAGSPRNVQLHLQRGRVGPTADRLAASLDARVLTQSLALERELFGDVEPSERFLRRLGDLVLTHRDLGTWWGDHEPEELALVGMHGGLHPEEMLTAVAAVRLSELF